MVNLIYGCFPVLPTQALPGLRVHFHSRLLCGASTSEGSSSQGRRSSPLGLHQHSLPGHSLRRPSLASINSRPARQSRPTDARELRGPRLFWLQKSFHRSLYAPDSLSCCDRPEDAADPSTPVEQTRPSGLTYLPSLSPGAPALPETTASSGHPSGPHSFSSSRARAA